LRAAAWASTFNVDEASKRERVTRGEGRGKYSGKVRVAETDLASFLVGPEFGGPALRVTFDGLIRLSVGCGNCRDQSIFDLIICGE